MSLFEAPSTKTLSRALLFRVILWAIPTYDCLNKPKPVKLVIVAVMVILSNRYRVWTMCLCMDSVKFILEAPGAAIVWGATILWQLADYLGGFLLGRALLIGALRYAFLKCLLNCYTW